MCNQACHDKTRHRELQKLKCNDLIPLKFKSIFSQRFSQCPRLSHQRTTSFEQSLHLLSVKPMLYRPTTLCPVHTANIPTVNGGSLARLPRPLRFGFAAFRLVHRQFALHGVIPHYFCCPPPPSRPR